MLHAEITPPPAKIGFKRAFTLIEMSITLVIIALVIGGILVGQSLIQAANVRNGIKQLVDLQTQVATFRGKYDCLPGDCTNITTFLGTTDSAGHAIVNGDGDGLIRSTVGNGAPYMAGECVQGGIYNSELPQAFLQLSVAKTGSYVSDGISNQMNAGYPPNAFGNGTGLLLTCLQSPTIGGLPLDTVLGTGNVILLGAYPNNTNNTNRIVYISGLVSWALEAPVGVPADYLQKIDQKIDDGLPASGIFGVVGASGSNASNPGTACLANSNTAYPASSAPCLATAGIKLGF